MSFKAIDVNRAALPSGDNGRVAWRQTNDMFAELYSTVGSVNIANLSDSVSSLSTTVTNLLSSVSSLNATVASLSNTVNEIVAFKAGKRGATSDNQVSLTHQDYTQVTFLHEFFDEGSCYDTTTSRWTPGVAGLVELSGQTWLSSNVASPIANVVIKVWKNRTDTQAGTEIGTGIGFAPAAFAGMGACQVPATIDICGSTDHYSLWQYGEYQGGANIGEIDGNPHHTWFRGVLLKRL